MMSRNTSNRYFPEHLSPGKFKADIMFTKFGRNSEKRKNKDTKAREKKGLI